MSKAEMLKLKDLPFNPGEIVEVNGWPRWKTKVGPFELTLDIVSVGESENKRKLGIASFVVMEQEIPLLDYLGGELARAIATNLSDERKILLVTSETKGSYFVPYVFRNLYRTIGSQLLERMVIFRKGEPKVYMQRPIKINNQEIQLPVIKYQSITSVDEQILSLSPKDAEFLIPALSEEADPIIADDFIGQGGTIWAIYRYLISLGLPPPKVAAVVGSDGNLFQETFTREGINIKLLPKPFPLRLPTFTRQNELEPWRVNI